MISLLSKDRNPEPRLRIRVSLESGFDGPSSEIDSTRPFPLNTSQPRSSGAFERFDRNSNPLMVVAMPRPMPDKDCIHNRRSRVLPMAQCANGRTNTGATGVPPSKGFLNRDKSQGGSPGYPLICVPIGTDKEMARLVPVRTGKGR